MSSPRCLGSLLLVALVSSSLTSCSFFTDFVVVNRTDGPALVTWSFAAPQGAQGSGHCPMTEAGYEASLGTIVRSRFLGDRFERQSPAPAFRVVADGCRATATLGPGAAMSLHQETNFVPSNTMDQERLGRLRIEIQGPAGGLTVPEGQALQRLARRGDQLYELTYQ